MCGCNCNCKKVAFSVVIIFAVWSLLDMLIHGVWLAPVYKETAALWRPCAEMKCGLMHLITFLMAIPFTMIYAILINPKTVCRGVRYGIAFGVISGLGAGFGSYCVMPIPMSLAWSWFFGTIVQYGLAGLVLGLLIKDGNAPTTSTCCITKPPEK